MEALGRFVRAIDALNEWTGRGVAWLTAGCVLTCFVVVVLRYGFDTGYPGLQELYIWQHAIVFMAGAGYTMLHRGHVNVDLVYGRLGERGRAWVDVLGTVLFLGYGSDMTDAGAFRFSNLTRTSDSFFAKLSYLFRL